jgi:hypothetical protein
VDGLTWFPKTSVKTFRGLLPGRTFDILELPDDDVAVQADIAFACASTVLTPCAHIRTIQS